MGTEDTISQWKEWYTKNHKKLMIIPCILLIIAGVMLFLNYQATGEVIERDVSLKGGITITVYTEQEVDEKVLEENLKRSYDEVIVRELAEFGTEEQIGFVVEVAAQEEEKIKSLIEESTNIKLTDENLSIEVVGSSLGESFYRQMVKSVVMAFLFMAVMVFIIFRAVIPSLAVVLAAFMDIVITIAIVGSFGMRMSGGGIAALLLLIGYSIDTDILLTTRVIRRKEGKIMDGIFSSVKTGLTMTVTTVIAVTIAYFLSQALILKQIFLIIVVGLLVDVVITYFLNAPLIIMYAEKKEKTKVYTGDEQ